MIQLTLATEIVKNHNALETEKNYHLAKLCISLNSTSLCSNMNICALHTSPCNLFVNTFRTIINKLSLLCSCMFGHT